MNVKIASCIIGMAGVLFPTIALAAFPDVSEDHPNYDAITYLQKQDIVRGYSDGTFKPDAHVNRAEFVKILIESDYPPGYTGPGPQECLQDEYVFPDVHRSVWYAPYACVASSKDIIAGYPDGTFQGDRPINFAEAAKIIVKVFVGNLPSDPIWYKPSVQRISDMAAIPLTIQNFAKNITRGEMAEMIYRLKTNVTTKASRTYDELANPTQGSMSIEDARMALMKEYWDGFRSDEFDTPPVPDCNQAPAEQQRDCMIDFYCDPAASNKQNACRTKARNILFK